MLMISVDEVIGILEEYAVCTPDEEKSLIQRINQASMFIDNIGTVSKWVRVEDRLPEPDMRVLTYSTDGIITHWMSLPEPPKE